jgi:dihydroorotate dehydrogenase
VTFKENLNSIFDMLYDLIKPCLFKLEPESAHDLALMIARLAPSLGKMSGTIPDPRLSLCVGSNQWASPIGLAAGLDKNAEALTFFEGQGFGALECGTVTLRPQLGNDRPRMFRYPLELSLRNAMGFPNKGLLDILPRLKAHEGKIPLGVNIGKNKESNAEESIEELTILFDTMASYADYFVVNVSSPNTPGLRGFQEKTYLNELFTELNALRKIHKKDLYLKIAPDLEAEKVKELVSVAVENKLTGLIATNTTIMPDRGIGGISGELLRERSQNIRRLILQEKAPIELIGVGGFTYLDDIFKFWSEGGKALQVYTSYVYQGPELLKDFQKGLLSFLENQELKNLEDFFALALLERKERLVFSLRNREA